MVLFLASTIAYSAWMVWPARGIHLPAVLLLQASGAFFQEASLFNILIALVFGFSTLNILGLVTRGMENRPSRLKPGEIMALTAMVLAICFLGLEMLHTFHIFPIQLGN